MTKYIDMLRRLNSEKRPPSLLPKLSKAPFSTFDSNQSAHFQEKTAAPEVPDHRALTQTDDTVATAAAAFHNHLFGPGRSTGCCAARHGRCCAEGAQLRGAYHTIHHH